MAIFWQYTFLFTVMECLIGCIYLMWGYLIQKENISKIPLRRVGQPTSALFSQGLENSPEVADASAGYSLRVRTKIEDLDGNITLIIMFD